MIRGVCLQKGWFSTLHLQAVAPAGGVSWLAVLSTVFLLTGLALDYEIFLLERVRELRRVSVLQTREAIRQGMALAGPVISSSNIIMALICGAFVDSNVAVLNQVVFILGLGVLLDGFVVRLVLVPCVLSTCGWLNWWPRVMPLDFNNTKSRSAHNGSRR